MWPDLCSSIRADAALPVGPVELAPHSHAIPLSPLPSDFSILSLFGQMASDEFIAEQRETRNLSFGILFVILLGNELMKGILRSGVCWYLARGECQVRWLFSAV
jgi:hypothetical protein